MNITYELAPDGPMLLPNRGWHRRVIPEHYVRGNGLTSVKDEIEARCRELAEQHGLTHARVLCRMGINRGEPHTERTSGSAPGFRRTGYDYAIVGIYAYRGGRLDHDRHDARAYVPGQLVEAEKGRAAA